MQDERMLSKRHLMAGFLSFVAMSAASMTFAGETAWQEVADGAELRVISSDVFANGRTVLALELRMAPGLQTYWRVPGETGIPTQVSLVANGVALESEITWPYPERKLVDGYLDYVYHDYLVLPVEVEHSQDVRSIDATVIMGICSDICVPVKADFNLMIELGSPDVGHVMRIEQAQQLAPFAWDQKGEPFGKVAFDVEENSLIVPFTEGEIDPDSIIATIDGASYVFGLPKHDATTKNTVRLDLLAKKPQRGLMGKTIRLNFMTSSGAYEIVRTL